MFWIVDEVLLFDGIGFEVKELLYFLLGPVEVFVVFSNEGFGGGDEFGISQSGVLVEEFAAPLGRFF